MSQIEKRKDEHLRICLEENVASDAATGLGGYRLEYDALPEVDLDEVDLSVVVLGKRLAAPLLIGSMTGGSAWAGQLNQRLARVAAKLGLGMGLGSQRAMLKNPDTTASFDVRTVAPDLPLLLGNVGAVQLRLGVGVPEIRFLLDAVGADGLFFHLNPLQEAIQPEGDTQFRGLFSQMAAILEAIDKPCLVKEVGAGISERTAQKLARLPLAGIEASGVGGTSWARVEGYRSKPGSRSALLGERLRGFGIPTAASIRYCRQAFLDRLVIGSGGIRTGMDIAVALALGADVVALARPVLEAAAQSEEAAESFLSTLIHELRIICFCTGVSSIRELRTVRLFPSPPSLSSQGSSQGSPQGSSQGHTGLP